MVIKQCLKKGICGKVYKEGDDGYELNYCKLCGAPLEERETKDDNKSNDKIVDLKSNGAQGKKAENIFVDKYGYIHLSEGEMTKSEKGPKFIVYNEDSISGVVRIDGEKAIVDSNAIGITLNNGTVSNCNYIEETISVYSQKGEYYIEKISEKGVVVLNNETIPNNKSVHISNGEIIVLGSNNWIEFEIN